MDFVQKYYKKVANITTSLGHESINIANFKWSYDIQGCNKNGNNINYVIVVIQETYQGVATSGGSSFTLLIRSPNTMDFCPVMDLFNGTYIAKCPVHEKGSTIMAECHFVNFMAFSRLEKRTTQQVFEEKPDKYLGNKTEHRTFSTLQNCTKFKTEHPQRGWWVKVNNRWRWFTGRCLVPIINNTVLTECCEQL